MMTMTMTIATLLTVMTTITTINDKNNTNDNTNKIMRAQHCSLSLTIARDIISLAAYYGQSWTSDIQSSFRKQRDSKSSHKNNGKTVDLM